jgi:hypothetical protein
VDPHHEPISKTSGWLRHVSGSTKSKLAAYSIFGSDLTVQVLQRNCVNACQLYVIEGYRESYVVHQIEIPAAPNGYRSALQEDLIAVL